MKLACIIIITLFLCERFNLVSCSIGDSTRVYRNCLDKFEKENCTNKRPPEAKVKPANKYQIESSKKLTDGESFNSKAALQQDFWSRLLQWSCREECRYQCMWITVGMFHKSGEDTPKFHGRWPFTRVLGMQEPASAFASVLNFAANAYMFKKIRQIPSSKATITPFVKFWRGFAMVCMNAWVWSTIFHMRDTWFTEFMDYACALSMVMGLFVAAIVRVFYKKTKLATLILLLVPLFYFVTHVRYLYAGVINYDYNMKVNIVFGVLGSVIWLAVSWHQWVLGRRYAWRMLAFTLLSGAALMLELFDFPPKFSIWDAHALWHLSTAPLPLLFYRYVIDDLRYLGSREMEKFALKLT